MEIDKRPDENSGRAFSGTWTVTLGSENKNQMPLLMPLGGWGRGQAGPLDGVRLGADGWVWLEGGFSGSSTPLVCRPLLFLPAPQKWLSVCGGLFSSLLFIIDPTCACMKLFLSPL